MKYNHYFFKSENIYDDTSLTDKKTWYIYKEKHKQSHLLIKIELCFKIIEDKQHAAFISNVHNEANKKNLVIEFEIFYIKTSNRITYTKFTNG